VAIRNQRIDIGYGVEKVRRVVYDYRSDDAWRIQTGYVQYDNNQVPVWREYDPHDNSYEAGWRTGLWRNIYSLVMPQAPRAKYVSYQTTAYEVRPGEVAMLPKVEVRLTYLLREHLAQLPGDPTLTSPEH
jgi:hypothetical protein